MNSNIAIPEKQRALVLQGGGALGAYEVGVLKVLCKNLHESKESAKKEEPLFDVVAGTSMGAMNAAVLVSNVVNKNKTWEKAVKELESFWTNDKKGLSSNPDYTTQSDYSKWWWNEAKEEKWKPYFTATASTEAARRYYSVKEYIKHGTPNVCSPPLANPDYKFADLENVWFKHTNDPLKDSIERYSKGENNEKLRIATSWDKRQPRLLVISVDVAEGKTVTFDSYHRKEEHHENLLYEGDGITIDHVMSSGTILEFYDFRKIGGRKFCDGGLLSNTRRYFYSSLYISDL